MQINRIGDFSLSWGESLCWDDEKNRLYFVDCASNRLHWLNNAEPPLHTLNLPSLPTAIVLTKDGRLLMALEDGLNLIDADTGSIEFLTGYPEKLGHRANDGTVDCMGNFVTGTLKDPLLGSYWWYSYHDGWRQLDDGISNANGPVTFSNGINNSLVFADSPARKLYAYDYNPKEGKVSNQRLYADTSKINGQPDGACATRDGSVLSCIIGPGVIAQYNDEGLQQALDAGSEQPSDITFGGKDLNRLFVVSIKVEFGHGTPHSPLAGALVEIEDSGLTGVRENRFRI